MARLKTFLAACLFASGTVIAQEHRAIVEVNAYKFPPPPSNVNRVLHTFAPGDLVQTKYDGGCGMSTCQVQLPDGRTGWIYSHMLTTEEDLTRAQGRYQSAGWEEMSEMDLKVWSSIRNEPEKIDKCALKLAWDSDYRSRTDWPAFCETFRHTQEVQAATQGIKNRIDGLNLDDTQMEMVKDGKVWIGAPKDAVRVSWGLPNDINRTVTSNRTREQWVYGSGHYVYIEDGKVVALQD